MRSSLRLTSMLLACLALANTTWGDKPSADATGDHGAAAETHEADGADAANAADSADDDSEGEDTGTYDKTIRWATASEVDNFGYDIYRGLSEDGPFERLTEEPIAGAGTTDEPTYYTYLDENLDPSQDYYYYIESISMHGQRERFTPIQKVAAPKPVEEPQD